MKQTNKVPVKSYRSTFTDVQSLSSQKHDKLQEDLPQKGISTELLNEMGTIIKFGAILGPMFNSV